MHVYLYYIVTHALHLSRHFVTGSRKVHVTFLSAYMGHCGDDCKMNHDARMFVSKKR